MLWYVPHIYGDFHCIATACKHNCCIGWEIDIDDRTKEAYRGVAGPFGERLANSICEADGVSSFRLTEGERCPFLNCQNLCDIHLVLGEEALCQICRDHPRFRNYFSSRGEIGLGLSCEAAARLILNRQEPMTFIPLFDDGEDGVGNSEWEDTLLRMRETLYHIAQNRNQGIDTREEQLLTCVNATLPSFPWMEWVNIFLSLERMDPLWETMLAPCKEVEGVPQMMDETPYEQFLVYLIFRHVADAVDEYDLKARVAFCVLSSRLLRVVASVNPTVELTECARLFSAEVEYSEDNTGQLLALLEEQQMEVS